MGDRYIYATKDVALLHPTTGKPLTTKTDGKESPLVFTWTDVVRAICTHPKVRCSLDFFDLHAARNAMLALEHGGAPAIIRENVHEKIVEALKIREDDKGVFSMAFDFSPGAEDVYRAFTDAPTKPREEPAPALPAPTP